VPAYVIGARARVNPIKLSRLVRGHDPLTPDLALRIVAAVQTEEAIANGR
jgi:plasmid maintenance system antidote protein VapI